MVLVVLAHPVERDKWQKHVEHVTELAAHLPGWDLGGVSLLVQIVDATVQPVSVAINVELLEVSELVERMVLQVVRLDLVVLWRLRLILEPILRHQAGGLERHLVLWVVTRVVIQAGRLRRELGSLLLLQQQDLHASLKESPSEHLNLII